MPRTRDVIYSPNSRALYKSNNHVGDRRSLASNSSATAASAKAERASLRPLSLCTVKKNKKTQQLVTKEQSQMTDFVHLQLTVGAPGENI